MVPVVSYVPYITRGGQFVCVSQCHRFEARIMETTFTHRDNLLLEAGFLAIVVAPFNLVFWKRSVSNNHSLSIQTARAHLSWWLHVHPLRVSIELTLLFDLTVSIDGPADCVVIFSSCRPVARSHDGLTLWLARWLLFRLMFASGVVKLQSQCPTWWGLTALNHHFESQVRPGNFKQLARYHS